MTEGRTTDRLAAREQNRRAWDALAAQRSHFAQPAKDQELQDPLAAVDAPGWLGSSIRNWRTLCLAAGGGRHSALYAAAGACVTVVDISPQMLALDRQVAHERGLDIRIVETSMDDLSMLADASFDLVIHPVSTCYVPNVLAVYGQVARVTAPGGLYISQHKAPASMQARQEPGARGYELAEAYYRSGPLPPVAGSRLREEGTLEYLHRWEDLLGGMCRAGFVIEDLLEPRHDDPQARPGTLGHRSRYVAPYVRVKARRKSPADAERPESKVWIST